MLRQFVCTLALAGVLARAEESAKKHKHPRSVLNRFEDKGMSMAEPQYGDYIWPWANRWPRLEIGKDWEIGGYMHGRTYDFEAGEFHEQEFWFDQKINASRDFLLFEIFFDAERTVVATSQLANVKDALFITYMAGNECTYEDYGQVQMTPTELLTLLWMPNMYQMVWDMGDMCLSEEQQDLVGFTSDDIDGFEWTSLFNKTTGKMVRATSGIPAFPPQDGDKFESIMTSEIEYVNVLPRGIFERDDFWIHECMDEEEEWQDNFEEMEGSVRQLTGDSGFMFL